MTTGLTALDQDIKLSPTDLAILDKAHEIVEKATKAGDPSIAFKHINNMRRAGRGLALGTAKIFHELEQRWEHFATDEDFLSYAFAETGYATQTIRKYIDVWIYVIGNEYLTKSQKAIMMGKEMPTHLRISPFAKQDQLTKDHWKRIVLAPDRQGVLEVLDEVRGDKDKPGPKRLTLILSVKGEEKGELRARLGNEAYKHVAFVDLESDDATVVAAISRLISAAGIVEV